MAAINFNNSYVDVYIWFGKHQDGFITNAFGGGVREGGDSPARTGHASLMIYPNANDANKKYASFWPLGNGGKERRPAQIVSDPKYDEANEGSIAHAIIRLHHLNVPEILSALDNADKHVKAQKLKYKYDAGYGVDASNPGNDGELNCSGFVYSLLRSGGIEEGVYKKHCSARGPYQEFYQKTRCNIADIAKGYFNGLSSMMFGYCTPHDVLLWTASAAEGYDDDKKWTEEIMSSNLVAKIEQRDKGYYVKN